VRASHGGGGDLIAVATSYTTVTPRHSTPPTALQLQT